MNLRKYAFFRAGLAVALAVSLARAFPAVAGPGRRCGGHL